MCGGDFWDFGGDISKWMPDQCVFALYRLGFWSFDRDCFEVELDFYTLYTL